MMTKDKPGNAGAAGSASGAASSSGVPPVNPSDQVPAGDELNVAPVGQASAKKIQLAMPKVPCKIDLNAVDLPKQMDDFNDAFRDALIVANLIRDDGTYAVSQKRIMAIWRSNLTQEIKDSIKEIKFDEEYEREDYDSVSEKLVQMCKVRGLARMNDFNLSLVIREATEPLEQFKKRLLAQASLCEWANESEKNRALVNQLVRGVNSDSLCTKLLQSDLQSFEELMAHTMQLETTEKGSQKIAEAMAGSSSAPVHKVEDVHALRARGGFRGLRFSRSNFRGQGSHMRSDNGQAETIICKHCCSRHAKSREMCAARDHSCAECGRQGHFEAFCYKAGASGYQQQSRPKRRAGQGSYNSPPKRGRGQEYGYAMHDEQYDQAYGQEEILRDPSNAASPGQVSSV